MAEAPVPQGHPMMRAWEKYKTEEQYTNTRQWALVPAHVDGSLWAAFAAGFQAGEIRYRHALDKIAQCGQPDSFAAKIAKRVLREGGDDMHPFSRRALERAIDIQNDPSNWSP